MRYDPPDTTGADALSETIGGIFDIPDQDLDNQLADIASVSEVQDSSSKISKTDLENSDAASDFGDLF